MHTSSSRSSSSSSRRRRRGGGGGDGRRRWALWQRQRKQESRCDNCGRTRSGVGWSE